MKKFLVLLVCLAVLASMTACTTVSAGLAPSSTPIAGQEYTKVGASSGSGWGVYLFGGLPLSEANPTAKARDRAVSSASADALVNCSVDTKIYNLGFFVVQRTQVNGDAIKFN